MARKGRIYLQDFYRTVKRSIKRPMILRATVQEAKKELNFKKRKFLREFDKHNITQEIKRGPTARKNISGTLPGLNYEAGHGGNLFSFIGFPSSEKPIEVLRAAISSSIYLGLKPVITQSKKRRGGVNYRVRYKIYYPEIQDLINFTPMPWEPGSWLKKIEKGMSGLGFYLWQRKGYGDKSRSGMALQARDRIRTTQFVPKPYLNEVINKVFYSRR